MKNKLNRISLIIISTFIVMITMSLITIIPQVMEFMGDFKCNVKEFHYGTGDYVLEHWHYGWTHWLYIMMGLCLFIIQIIRVIFIIEEKKV